MTSSSPNDTASIVSGEHVLSSSSPPQEEYAIVFNVRVEGTRLVSSVPIRSTKDALVVPESSARGTRKLKTPSYVRDWKDKVALPRVVHALVDILITEGVDDETAYLCTNSLTKNSFAF